MTTRIDGAGLPEPSVADITRSYRTTAQAGGRSKSRATRSCRPSPWWAAG